MRTLVVCLAIFLALAVLHCDGKKRNKGHNCHYHESNIKNGDTRNLRKPCERVTCTEGLVNVTKCPSKDEELEELLKQDKILRKERKMKKLEEGNEDDDEEESEEEKVEKKGKKGRPFPRCCKRTSD